MHLAFDAALPYLADDQAGPLGPRITVALALHPQADVLHQVRPVVDSGAAYSASDGTVALLLGLTENDLISRASEVRPIHGIALGGAPLTGYLHELTCFIPLGRRYASLQILAFLTPPNTLRTPVLGRRNFFEQVDIGIVEAERQVLLRFRQPGAMRLSW